MRNLIIHGMRRNGTTVLFDAFVRDARFTTLYEPLSAVRAASRWWAAAAACTRRDLFGAVAERPRGRYAAAHPDRAPAWSTTAARSGPRSRSRATCPVEVEDYLRLVLATPAAVGGASSSG